MPEVVCTFLSPAQRREPANCTAQSRNRSLGSFAQITLKFAVQQLDGIGAPTVSLGPGHPQMAHQTDEWCENARIEKAVDIYARLIATWCGLA